ncbi:hypothetical protein BDB01DRAFT_809296 [Pilobolus umbonatus]|nr:hypothetical protein BDB01DRAFT_809296 [Pilobolus umbonatus]
MSDPITHCLSRLHLDDVDKVQQRAHQFLGQMSKIAPKTFDKGPNCKPVICIQLAYESLKKYDWDMNLAAELAGCSPSAYESVLSIVRRNLNIIPTITFDTLIVTLGCTSMTAPVDGLWTHFSTRYLQKLTGQKKINTAKELELPYWKGAVLYACAKSFGENLNKQKVQSICSCSGQEFNKALQAVRTTCEKELTELKQRSNKTRGRKRKVVEKEEPVVEVVEEKKTQKKKKKNTPARSGVVSMVQFQDFKETKKYAEYVKWSSSMIEELKSRIQL